MAAPASLTSTFGSVTKSPFYPPFETEVLADEGETIVRREPDGIIKRVRKHGVSMPQFLKFPVESRKDWEEIKWRLDPTVEERYEAFRKEAKWLRGRDHVLRFGVCGAYGHPRNLFGEENLAYIYYDDPKLLHEIMENWVELYIGIADHICPLLDFDYVFMWEDMAYKTGPLISPRLVREFMLPYYKQLIQHLRSRHGIDIFLLDTDGNPEVLLPIFIEAGINVLIPLEIAAGTEPLPIREKYGEQLALMGGIDKRALTGDKETIKREVMRKVPAMLESGGYIPGVDHAVPHDVPFENYCYFVELLRELGKNP